MNQRVLALIAIACSPFLLVDFLLNGMSHNNSWTIGFFDMIYMTGWMASIIAFSQLKATGGGKLGKAVLVLQMIFLIIAQLSSFLAIFNIRTSSAWFSISDLFWPLSNVFMIVTGIAVIKAKVLKGWRRFIPLIMGLWLPVTGVIMNLFNPDVVLLVFSGPYSAIAWALLGLAIYTTKTEVSKVKQRIERSSLRLPSFS